ncbi:MAG: PAS domain S-box protein, partial [Chitinivibrionales bacterium]
MSCFDTTGTLSEHCYETILQTMAEGVFIVDTNGIIRFCNQALEILSGYAAHELIGRDCRHIMMCSCSSMEECSLFSEKSLNNAECRIRRKNGTTVPVLKNGRVMYDDAGEARGAVETVTDISVLKKAEYRLAELEGEMKGKSSFHGIIGHSRPMREVFELIDLAAASNATLLVNGETGTGKEMVAQAI